MRTLILTCHMPCTSTGTSPFCGACTLRVPHGLFVSMELVVLGINSGEGGCELVHMHHMPVATNNCVAAQSCLEALIGHLSLALGMGVR